MPQPKRKKRRLAQPKKCSARQALNALKKIAPEYQGWTASILWYQHSPKENETTDEKNIHAWKQFKINHVPLHIPKHLDNYTMLNECKKINLPFNPANSNIRNKRQKPQRRETDPNNRTPPGYDLRPSENYFPVPRSSKNKKPYA